MAAVEWNSSGSSSPIRPRGSALCCLTLLAVFITGCDWWLRITQVTGTVSVDGKPASGVQVVFEPLSPNRPRAVAMTNRDGVYRLGRQGPGRKSGAASGRYRVEIMSDADGKDAFLIPPEYNVQSTLEFDVVPGKANVFDIDIKSK